jgi:DNA replication and repair protein RecF
MQSGLVLAVGPNGAGKTNLLEALHVGTQGFSPRTRTDAQLVRFGAQAARIELQGVRADAPVEVELTLRPGDAKRARLNGETLRAAEQLRSSLATLVFTPDRLVVVKGGPSARRAYFDRTAGRLFPARAVLPVEYAAAVAQRNAALRRASLGLSSREAVEPWTERVADLGAQLVEVRVEVTRELGPLFGMHAEALGLEQAELCYEGDPPEIQALEKRLDEDLERGTTGLGPHLHDFAIAAGGRELRRFGSQGEQRLAVLSLLLAEAELLALRGPAPPLLLLDDVLSELDERRRRTLAERIGAGTQALITSTSAAALPAEPDQLVEIAPGTARSVA